MSDTKAERLFIAIDLPDEIRMVLQKSVRTFDLKGARYSRLDQMHLTLRFLGKVYSGQKECVIQKLDEISGPSFDLEIDKLGVFPERGMPRVLWVGLKESDTLNEIQGNVETGVQSCGFEAESRPWRPHITLARLKGRNYLTRETLDSTGIGGRTLKFSVNAFYLYRSELKKSGAVYSIVETFKLTEG